MSADDDIPPRFHRGFTLFLALFLCFSFCFAGARTPFGQALEFEHPAQTAQDHFERWIEIETALKSEPEWVGRGLSLVLGRTRPALSEAIDAYDEVVALQSRAFAPPAPAAESSDGTTSTTPPDLGAGSAPAGAPTTTETPTPADRSTSDGSAVKPGEPAAPEAATPDRGGGAFACVPPTIEPPLRDDRTKLVELLARMAILQGEANRAQDVQNTLLRLERLGAGGLARTIDYAYSRLEPLERASFASFDLSPITPGWARERLELRLAERTDEADVAARIRADDDAHSAKLRQRATFFFWGLFGPVALGLVFLLAWLLLDRPALPSGSAAIPAAWTFEEGFAVLTRSVVAVLAIRILVPLALEPFDLPFTLVLTALLFPIPLFVLMQRGLFAPRVLSFVRVFGLDAFPGSAWKWIGIVLAVFCADQLGGMVIFELTGRAGLSLHWSELVQEPLRSSGKAAFTGLAVLDILWMPLFLDIGCRGLLYLTLRARMPAMSAVLWSSALVAAFSNASLPSFIALIWTGCVFAYTFERTKSLMPAFLCSALNALGMVAAIALLFR